MASERLKGVTLLAFGDNATANDKDFIKLLFCAIGDAVEVDEKEFGILGDLKFALAANRWGISQDLAERLIKQTLAGTAQLLEEEGFQHLACRVATKGGITEAGEKVIRQEASGMFDLLFQDTQAKHDQVKRRLDSQA